ncbi:Trm112 family protein [Sapientia aquatica]|uniref:UPF0434 protein E2I14_05770 n=1 Tax=Sapientia aquatica TaxID=1549640 RepID=A0A4V3AUY8_9BURK|nr:Trm112 family protein [Sapientia aquatica]TDK67268.1 Trm112 family protein [Sapientia aquatica]
MDTRLLDILVCPLCKGPLVYNKAAQELICKGDKLAYPIRDDIPIMWADQARELNSADMAANTNGPSA